MSRALREHIEYLTLPGRNARYREAITSEVEEGDSVADLGCGVGVLGLFCLEAGASQVWGIDNSEAIHLAREAMDRAGLGQRYNCIEGSTFSTQLREQVDLIICDHVGFFGFDYGIVPMMRDARQRMLKPGGKLIPQALELMLAGVSSDPCRKAASSWGQEIVPEAYHWLETNNRNSIHPHLFSADELITAPISLGSIELGTDYDGMVVLTGELTAEQDGRFDGLAGWFDCWLAGETRMTNSPLAEDSIKRAQAFLPALASIDVAKGDVIGVKLRLRFDEAMYAWTITPPGGARPQKLSTFNSKVLTPADLVKDSGQPVMLSDMGEARAAVLSYVDGERSSDDIVALVLRERPHLLPSENAIRDFVQGVLASECRI